MVVPPMVLLAVVYGRYLRAISKRTQDALAEATQVRLTLKEENTNLAAPKPVPSHTKVVQLITFLFRFFGSNNVQTNIIKFELYIIFCKYIH